MVNAPRVDGGAQGTDGRARTGLGPPTGEAPALIHPEMIHSVPTRPAAVAASPGAPPRPTAAPARRARASDGCPRSGRERMRARLGAWADRAGAHR